MSEIDGKVLGAVEAALKRNPDATVDELFAIARGVDEGVAGLSKRQFHARYPLQVKRRMSPPKRRRPAKARAAAGRGRKAPAGASAREAVRACFLRFAADLAAAEARKDLVRVVAGVDRYVDDVLKATGAA